MVTRSRLPKLKLNWNPFNPFKDEKTQLLERFHKAVQNGNSQEAQACYDDMKFRGFI